VSDVSVRCAWSVEALCCLRMPTPSERHGPIARARREMKRRVLRQFAGVEYVSTARHEDGSVTITFVTFDDNADVVLESLEDVLDELAADGIRVMVVPHE
jgi:hypothetical protein